MLEDIKVLCHSSIKFEKGKTIYFDPFKIQEESHDADIIMITHDHFDHYAEEDINKIKNENTTIVIPVDLEEKVLKAGWKKENIITVKPNQSYIVKDIPVQTIPSYNTNKQFHPKENEWVGYIIEIENVRYYIAGDTDITEENKKVNCDVAFVPIGGTYTMTAPEAATLINIMKPKIAVPIHYGSIVGTKQDAEDFIEKLEPTIQGKILMEKE